MAWLDALSARLAQTRDGTRERVTAVADILVTEVARLTLANQVVRQQLAEAEKHIAQLQEENAVLRASVGTSTE
jgi:regulator of replication initiation timing